MKHRFGTMLPRKLTIIAGSVLLYTVILILLFVMNFNSDNQEKQAVFGSVDDRFLSDITLEHEGDTWHYRENEITNYLLIGLDRESINRSTGYQNGGQADFLVVLSIDRINRTITPVMLDRDTMAQVQTYGVFGHPSGIREMQLCLAQAYSTKGSSGSDNTARTVEGLLYGVKIDHYVTLDISAVPLLNDAVGGVEVTLQDDFTEYDPQMVQGATIRLTGEQAEYFVRGRMTVADGTNASRMKRQQQYISGFLTQLHRELEKDPDKMIELLNDVSGHVQTDATEEILLRDADAYSGYEWKPMRTPEGTHHIDECGFAEFRVDEEDLRSMIANLWFSKEEQK